ncbi:DUF4157 domain-containing protein [Dokdonia ponticola]|uniref:DUF4157 domain-containing protein n=1 Tax=Dokdonia ponticola TaxID=2041041 RepID=A0ABV9HZ60_9FLAO
MFAAATKSSTPSRNPSLFSHGASTPFIQPKLEVGKPGDKYEVEADKAADQIVARSNDTSTPFFPATPIIQKQSEEDIQQQPVVDPIIPGIQRKETSFLQKVEEEEVQKSEENTSEEADLQMMTDLEQVQESSIENTIQSKETSQETTSTLPSVQQMSSEDLQKKEEEEIQEKEEEEVQTLQKQAVGDVGDDNTVSPSVENTLQSTKGGGSPLDTNTRGEMESGFGADFSSVRVHNDSTAVQMNQQLGAQAFTNGSDIYFNEGNYNPGSDSGKHLLAHELTHTVQQGGASIQRKPLQISSAPVMVQGFAISDLPSLAVNEIRDIARRIPGYTLFTVVIEYNPITNERVERTAINLVQGLLELIPVAGPAIFDKLQEYGILERAFDWVRGQLNELGLSSTAILDLIGEAWDELEFPYTNALEILTRKFNTLLNRVTRFISSLTDQLLTWIKEALIDVAEPYLEENQAWSLLKKVLHYDPLRDEEVQAETVEILEDFLMLIGKETELEQMRERGTLQETADWLDTQMGAFSSLLGQLTSLIDAAWDAIQPENLPNILESLTALATQAGTFLEGLWDFASTIAIEVLKLIKDALLGWLSTVAADIPGFTLLTVIIRTNPLTGEVVERSIQNIIRGFMGLVPGGEAKYQELRESGVIPRAAGQIEALIAQLGMSAATIIQLFTDLWNSFTIDDLVDPLPAFERITAQFGEPITKLFTFVVKVVKVLIELILEIMGIPPDMIANIIANAMSAFEDIKNDPVAFLMNLLDALKTGFLQFLNNIGAHLLSGLQNWLFGTLADAGVEIPSDLSIRSLLGMAMEVLGITLDNILERLAIRIGPERVEQIRSVLDTLTGVWAFVRDVIERGPIAIWEYIQDQISNLWNVIRDGIMGFIQERVIQQAIGWLLSFLDVTGIMPVIRGVQTAFNAITSFIEKIREILEIVNSFVAGIADIARGNIQSAANFLETALADGIPVAISFLAKQLGLGDISEKIAEMIENTRAMINEGIDWLIEQALAAGTAFLSALGLGGSDEAEAEEEGNETQEEGSENIIGLSNPVNVDGGHTLKIEGTIENIEVNVYSDKQTLNELLNDKRQDIHDSQDTDSEYEAKSSAITRLFSEKTLLGTNIGAYKRAVDNAYTSGHGNSPITEAYDLIRTNLTNIAADLVIIGVLDHDTELPVSEVSFETDSKGRSYILRAAPLSKIPGNTRGSTPTQNPQGWDTIPVSLRSSGAWVRAHLLNHRLHGPGITDNLFPGTRDMNLRDMENQVEHFAKEAVWDNNQVIFYNVDVSYGNTGAFEDIPTVVVMSFGPYDVETSTPGSPTKTKRFTQEPPSTSVRVTINSSSHGALNSKAIAEGGTNGTGLSGFFRRLVQGRPSGGYQNIIQVRTIVSSLYDDQNAFMAAFPKFNNLVNTNILEYD